VVDTYLTSSNYIVLKVTGNSPERNVMPKKKEKQVEMAKQDSPIEKGVSLMTPRTLDIIQRIANGYSNEQIRDELDIPMSELITLISQPDIQVAISDMSKEVMASFGNSKEQIQTMMRRVIVSDLTDFYNQDGTMKPFNQIPKLLRMCITELEFKHTTDAMGMPVTNTRIKTISKDKAVEILARLDHLFTEKPEKGGLTIEIGYD